MIIDDASTDGSIDAILKAARCAPEGWPVRVYRHQRNLGVAKTYEHGVFRATQHWIVSLDGDDIALADRIAHVESVRLSHPDAVLVADSVASFASKADNPYPLYATPGPMVESVMFTSSTERAEALLGRKPWKGTYCGAFSFKREIFVKFGAVSTPTGEYRPTQDKIILTRAFLSGPVVATSKMVLLYRSHETNLFHRLGRFEAKNAREQNAIEQWNASMSGQYASSLKQCLQDIGKAMQTPALSDFSADQLQKVEQKMKNDQAFQSLLSRYGAAPVVVRPFMLLANLRNLGPNCVKPFVIRMLPNLLFAKLKLKKNKREYSRLESSVRRLDNSIFRRKSSKHENTSQD